MANKMRGIDVSKWQGKVGFNPARMDADFIICKATQGTTIKDPYMASMANSTLSSGKLLGLYHFADGKTNGFAEAGFFLEAVKQYIGKAILVLDWEGNALARGVNYAKEFCDRIYNDTGIIPVLYTSTSVTTNYNWKDFISKYPYLWGAEYNKNLETHGYTENPVKKNRSLGGFTEIIRQYSSNTYLPGFPNRLDVNEAYITVQEWEKLAKKNTSSTPVTETKTNDEIAFDIANGVNGWKGVNGAARKSKLQSMGYDYSKIQPIVNKIILDRQKGIEWYIVKKGDNLSKIAKNQGITLNKIKEINIGIIKNYNSLNIGQWIRIK